MSEHLEHFENRKKEFFGRIIDTENYGDVYVFEHDSLQMMQNRVWYARAPEELTSEILNSYQNLKGNGRKSTKILAGDIQDEYMLQGSNGGDVLDSANKDLSFSDDKIKDSLDKIRDFIKSQIEDFFGMPIKSIDFRDTSCPGHLGEIENIWVNYMKPNEYNPIHNHTGVFSWVWYLDIPEEIRQEHKQQNSNSATRGLISFLSSTGDPHIMFNPKTSDIFIFNSKHEHQVYPFYSDNTRISMAGNVYRIEFENGDVIGTGQERKL